MPKTTPQKSTPSPMPPMPPPLLPHEIARSIGGQVQIRSEPMRVKWSFADLVTADGHRLRCSFGCGLKPGSEDSDKKFLAEALLAGKSAATMDDLIAYFAPSLQSTASNMAATKTVKDWLADGFKETLSAGLRKAVDQVAFACGLEVLPPFDIALESPSFQQQKLEMMERNLAEQRVAGQVEHFEKAATLLKQFDALRQAAPGLTPGAVLQQISPSEQGAMLQTLLLAAGKSSAAKHLWAVAGPSLVKIDPRLSPPKMELIPLPESLGPLRSVQSAEVDGQHVLLVGSRSGVAVVNTERPAEAQLYVDPEVVSQMGFSRAVAWRRGIWGCHGDAGIVGWEQGGFNRPTAVFRPTHLMPSSATPAMDQAQSIQMAKPGSAQNLTVLDEDRLIFSIGAQLLTLNAAGQITALPTESSSDVQAILPDRGNVFVIRSDGSVTTHDLATLAVTSEERRGGKINDAAVLPWLGSVRLLLASDDGPVQCLGTEDQLVTQYCSHHRGLKILTSAADWVVAVSADRQRLVMWNSWDGHKPAVEVSVAALAKHRVADVDFG